MTKYSERPSSLRLAKRPASDQNEAIWTENRPSSSFFLAIAEFKDPKIFKE